MVVDDERFKLVDADRFLNKPIKSKGEKEAVPGLLKPKFNLKKSNAGKKLLVTKKKDGNNKHKR